MSASIAASRFAVLKIEDSDDESNKKTLKTQAASQKKKKNKKNSRGRVNNKEEKDELRSLAFGNSKSSKAHKKSTPSTQDQPNVQSPQFDQWKEHDKEIVGDMFEQELQQAILASRLEQEKMVQEKVPVKSDDSSYDESVAKKKNKAKATPLGLFLNESPVVNSSSQMADQNKVVSNDGDFFQDVEDSTAHLLKKDRIHQQYTQQFKVQAVLEARHNEELKLRDELISCLKSQLQTQQEELANVKKRNKQLCYILGQGEMQEKSEILRQVESLTNVKDELVSQLESVSSELEKEKSKVHALQKDLLKYKGKGK